jgi:hypothetical protein
MKKFIFLLFSFTYITVSYAQIGIKADNTAPIASAQLEVQSTTKAFYPPRMTTALRTNMPITPQKGAVVFDTDLNGLFVYNGSAWVSSGLTLPYSVTQSSNTNLLSIENSSTNVNSSTILSQTTSSNEVGGITGYANNSTPTGNPSGIKGINFSTNANGYGVYGEHFGAGRGVLGLSNSGIGGFFTSSSGYALITGTGNVGIGTNTPNAPLQFSNVALNRKVVLYETANNDHQFYGLGINGFTFRYQVDATSASHVFYAATSTTTSNELMRIRGDGNVGIGVPNPLEKLHVAGNIRASSLAGTGVREVKADANGNLTTAVRTKYYSAPNLSFVQENTNGSSVANYFSGYVYGSTTFAIIKCPLYLPHGATITNVRIYYNDNDAANDLTFSIERIVVASGGGGFYGTTSSSGSSAGVLFVDIPLTTFTVDNQNNTYFIGVSPKSGASVWTNSFSFAVRNVVITYTE